MIGHKYYRPYLLKARAYCRLCPYVFVCLSCIACALYTGGDASADAVVGAAADSPNACPCLQMPRAHAHAHAKLPVHARDPCPRLCPHPCPCPGSRLPRACGHLRALSLGMVNYFSWHADGESQELDQIGGWHQKGLGDARLLVPSGRRRSSAFAAGMRRDIEKRRRCPCS